MLACCCHSGGPAASHRSRGGGPAAATAASAGGGFCAFVWGCLVKQGGEEGEEVWPVGEALKVSLRNNAAASTTPPIRTLNSHCLRPMHPPTRPATSSHTLPALPHPTTGRRRQKLGSGTTKGGHRAHQAGRRVSKTHLRLFWTKPHAPHPHTRKHHARQHPLDHRLWGCAGGRSSLSSPACTEPPHGMCGGMGRSFVPSSSTPPSFSPFSFPTLIQADDAQLHPGHGRGDEADEFVHGDQ